MDFNDFLRNTKTAAPEDHAGVKLPHLAGQKRHHNHNTGGDVNDATTASKLESSSGNGSGGGTPTEEKRSRRSGTAEGLNLRATQDALAQERGTTSAQAQQQRAQADLLSEQAAARMVHQVLEHVIQAELGGRHNASKGGVPPFVPTLAELAAEKAMWTRAAGYSIHHVVPANLEGLPDTLMSVTEMERVPEGVRQLRSSLQTCDMASDLVGGVRSGMAPHLRAHVLKVLERGLRGEAWVRDGTAAGSTSASVFGKPVASSSCGDDSGPSSVLLFRDATPPLRAEAAPRTGTSGAVFPDAAAAGSTAADGGFSLSAFLGEGNTSSSSSPPSDGDNDA